MTIPRHPVDDDLAAPRLSAPGPRHGSVVYAATVIGMAMAPGAVLDRATVERAGGDAALAAQGASHD